MTVREMLSRIGSDEITEWMAYFKLIENPELVKPKQSPEDIGAIFGAMAKKVKK